VIASIAHDLAKAIDTEATAPPPRRETLINGPMRTLSQDIAFGIDQLAEIAIRARSPAVNDTFTALTCVDWLGDRLCKIAVDWYPDTFHRDGLGEIRSGRRHRPL